MFNLKPFVSLLLTDLKPKSMTTDTSAHNGLLPLASYPSILIYLTQSKIFKPSKQDRLNRQVHRSTPKRHAAISALAQGPRACLISRGLKVRKRVYSARVNPLQLKRENT